MDKIKEYTQSSFVRGFAVKSAIFIAALLGLNMIIFLFITPLPVFRDHLKIPDAFYFSFLTGLTKGKIINAALFTAVMFVIYIRKKIPHLKEFPMKTGQTILFSVSAVAVFAAHYLLKYWINTNLDFALGISPVLRLVKYGLLAGFILLLALAIYGLDFIRYFVQNFYKEIAVFTAVFFAYWGLVELFQLTWVYLSTTVARSVGFFLSLTFKEVIVNPVTPKGPQVGVPGFAPYVSSECSGIDSLQLFISLMGFLLVLDWNTINRKRMAAIFIPGILMTFLYNVVRVYLILLVGIFYSPEFAIDTFHTNIGWILFLVVFFVFWHFGSKYVYAKGTK